ncbi:hypothetical protein TZ00_02785 [Agreia bicolorata]|uniref:AAA+ ATPase domain-containing protein n=2 Tax=Agreia bicolorata TaxID=110935 RepID=A0ABR5CJ90_9MICO|nr:hypothetical protein TZ00_02785 [Agreia bicolorata]
MAAEGTKSYLIITNVAATSKPKVGRMDVVDAGITKLGKEVGLDIWVWWRSDLDARLDSAPSELKFRYPNMLVGPDAMRALVTDMLHGDRLKKQALLVRSATATSLEADRNVGFRQGKLEGVPLDSLFVDVTARRTYNLGASPKAKHPGALELLLSAGAPSKIMIFGAPGQGKSTLVQKLCQEHRKLFVDPPDEETTESRYKSERDTPRIAFKIILRDYALWLTGIDPSSQSGKRRPASTTDSVESYAAHLLHVDSGGMKCDADEVVSIGNRFPTLFAFDGLDEVAEVVVRERAVKEITAFNVRSERWEVPPRILVTSRPSFNRLPEPTNDIFIQFNMDAISEELRIEYLRKWSRSQDLSGPDRRDVERIFRERSGQAHVRELATNPMQLTILLYLIHQRGDSIPQRRTNLYQDYLQAFLDREATKSAVVKKYRDELEDITAFLGWHLQALAEKHSGNGRATRRELIRATKHYLVDNGREALVGLADELFTTVTERVWALTSRTTGTFEFDVQSIREYFAARYLFDRAPIARSGSDDDVFARFKETAIRPYWANTARLMAGLFRYGEKAQLTDDLISQIADGGIRFWPRQMALTLVRDGIFDDQPAPRLRLLQAASDSVGVRIALRDIRDGSAMPIASDRGGDVLSGLMQKAIYEDPLDPLALERAQLLSEYMTGAALARWWAECVRKQPSHRIRWIELGQAAGVGTYLTTADLSVFNPDSPNEVSALLKLGAEPTSGSALSDAMVRCVLDGMNSSEDTSGRSVAASLAGVVDIGGLVSRADTTVTAQPAWDQTALARLKRSESSAANRLQASRRGHAGQQGTSSPFANLADTLHSIYGRCMLANEVAIIGASASKLRMGHAARKLAPVWGTDSVPSAIIRDFRKNAADSGWWVDQTDHLVDELDRSTWVLGVLTCTSLEAVFELLESVGKVLETLSTDGKLAIWLALARLRANSDLRRLQGAFLTAATDRSQILGELASLLLPEDLQYELDAATFADLALHRAGNARARDHAVQVAWTLLKSNTIFNPELLSAMLNTSADVQLNGEKGWPMPTALVSGIRADVPWALLRWANQSLEQPEVLATLVSVADAREWFSPAK